MTSQDDAFLQDILQHPADPFPQAVYADWLESQGRLPEAKLLRKGRMKVDRHERLAAVALRNCRYASTSAAKWFVQDVCVPISINRRHDLYVRQRAGLWSLVWHYRKQLQGLPEWLFSQDTAMSSLVQRAAWLLDRKEKQK